ncbi:HYR domain-containing protein, partial [Flavobacteriaceae bacterium]|nr:HYR domain-containing protein [Flavobacteriaceae bacterium]
WLQPTSADNCAGSSRAQTAGLNSSDTFPIGVTTITYTATDASSNTFSASFTVTVTDNENPTINNLPADITVNNGNGVCEAAVTWVEPTSADNCTGSTIAQTAGLANGATFPAGVTTITYTATDASSNTFSASFTVTVTDDEDPTITCAADQTATTDAGNCTAAVTVLAPTTADNCGVASVTNNFNGTADASGTYPIGTTTVVWTVTDNSGNIATCSMDITVTDNEAPNAVCQDITASVDASGNLTITGDDVDGGSTDNCTGMTLSVSPNTFDCTDTGTTVTVTLTATDAAGLTDTCTANVTIIDQVAPTAVCQDITVQLDATGNVTITAADVDNGSSDGCGGAVTLALTPSSSFDCDDLGANTVTLFVTDASGNSSFCTATVTVEDSVAPTITCAADQTQNLDAGLCTAAVTVAVPTISDNCSVASITNDFNSTADASDDYPLGTTTVTWTLTDGSGNTATCTQDIVVTDNQAPVAVCQDITVQLDATGAVTINASDLDGGSTDCSSMTFAVSPSSSFDCDDIGPNTVTLFVTDANGLIGFCSAVVTVEDSIDPTIVSIPGDITVTNDSGACGAVVSWTEPTTTDNCSSTISQTTGVANGLEFPVGTTTVTYVATDTAGNTTQDTFTVTVTDVEAPTASCVASPLTVQLDASGVATITADDINGGSSDNCTAANALTLAIDKTSFDCGDIGSTTVTLTVTDEYSNSATCTTTVNIVDTVAPAITCPANQTQSLGAGCVVTLAGYTGLATTSDNCAVSSVT